MKSLYDVYETDKALESESGVEIDFGVTQVTILRAGASNKKYLSVLEAKTAPFRRKMAQGTIDDTLSTKIMAEVYAEAVIIGWKNMKDRSGKNLPFTKENVVKVLIDLPDFFNQIINEANTLANFRKEALEEEAKNSKKS